MKFALAASLLLLFQGLPPLVGPLVPETGGRVIGIVRRADTGQPILGAEVGLAAPGASLEAAMARAVTTDVNGRFTMKSVAPGSYMVVTEADGYFSAGNNPGSGTRATRDIVVIEGQQTDLGALELVPAAAISGRLSGPDGRPVIRGSVQAWRASYVRGALTFNRVKITQTDDLGEYRLFWLPPGDYYISGQYRSAGGGVERYDRMFFPGVAEEELASPITVGGGQEISGIDIQIPVTPITGVTITGHLADEAGKTMTLRFPSVELVPRERRILLANDDSQTFANQNARGGRLEIHNVPPGQYDLIAVARENEGTVRRARVAVDVADRNIEDIAVILESLVNISGHVTLDGEVPGDRLKADSIVMMPLNGIAAKENPGIITPDVKTGEFTVSGISPGRYVLQLGATARSSDIYIDAVRQGESNVLDSGVIATTESHQTFSIELKSRAGAVSGTVLDVTRLRPFPHATVALVPESARRGNYKLFRETICEADGHFVFAGLPAGNYFLFAWQTAIPGASQDPVFLSRYENRAVQVLVEAGTEKNFQLVAIP